MTALAAPAPKVVPVSFRRILTSEWIKLRSVRSTPWTLALTSLAMVGIALVAGLATRAFEVGEELDAVDLLTGGTFFAQLAVVVLGVLAVTGEYTTGQIRSTFAAVPRRVPVLLAKSAVVLLTTALVTALATALAALVTHLLVAPLGAGFDLGSAETLRRVAGVPLYLSALAVLALAVGALLRSTAGALSLVMGLLLVLEQVIAVVPWAPFQKVAPYLPSSSGSRLMMSDEAVAMMNQAFGVEISAWQSYGVLLAWVVVLLGAACVLVRRRDA